MKRWVLLVFWALLVFVGTLLSGDPACDRDDPLLACNVEEDCPTKANVYSAALGVREEG